MASRPCGVSGVMTMKMISRTRSTSISGVTLMSALAPPPGPPTAIAIVNYSFKLKLMIPRASAWGPRSRYYRRGLTARRRFSTADGPVHGLVWYQIRQEADIFNTRRSEVVHYVLHVLVLRPGVGLDVNDGLVLFRRLLKKIFHLRDELLGCGARVPGAQVEISIARHCHDHGVFRVGLCHLSGVLPLVELDGDRLAKHRRDHHENNQQHEHHVHHRCDIDVGYGRRRLFLLHINSSKEAGGGWPVLPATCRRSLVQLARTCLTCLLPPAPDG